MMQYHRDVDTGAYVRHQMGAHVIEVREPGKSAWRPAPPDSSYERELYLGEGCSLFPVSKEEAEGVQSAN
ncbi:MAG: hypothetical protein ACI4XW_01640 [Candidatus Spyradocola sp.]